MNSKYFVFLLIIICLTFNYTEAQSSSLYLPSSPKYVQIGDLDVTGDQLTVEALIHYTGASVNILSKHTGPANVNYLFRIGSFEITTTSGFANFGGVAAAGVNLVAGETYHVAATYNGEYLKYYVNGCKTGEMPWTGDMVTNDFTTAIGQMTDCECEQFKGYIDELRVWNVARTQQEIANNMMDLSNPTTTPGLLAYYKFDGDFTNSQGNATWDGVPINNPELELIPDPYPQVMNASISSSDPLCHDEDNGVIDVAGSGAYEPYEFSLDGTNFTTNSTFDNVSAGNYTVYARPHDNNECVVTNTIQLDNPSPIASNLNIENVSCFGGDDGKATITPAGGNGPDYSHDWTPSTTNDLTIEDLEEGNYNVAISDSCKTFGEELVENGHFENGYSGFTTDYNQGVYASQMGDKEYALTFDPSIYHSGFSGNGAGGTGNLMVVNGALVQGENVWCQTIDVNPNTFYNFSLMISSMVGDSPAELEITVNGDAFPNHAFAPGSSNIWENYEESWFSGTSTQANICITDKNIEAIGNDFGLDNISFKECASCTESFPFVITQPDELEITNIDLTPESCEDKGDGEIEIITSGGTGDLEYSIDDGGTFQQNHSFSNLSAGNYIIVVKDDNDCEISDTITIEQPDPLELIIENFEDVSCSETNDGKITVNATGGTPEYTYTVGSESQNSPYFDSLTVGQYDVLVVDENGCSDTLQQTISPTPSPEINLPDTIELCLGESWTPNATGADSYDWTGGLTNGESVLGELGTEVFVVTGTSTNGCTEKDSITVITYNKPNIDFTADTLEGLSPLTVNFENTSTGANSFLWDFGDGSTEQNNNTSVTHLFENIGTYPTVLTGTSNDGCSNTSVNTIYVLPPQMTYQFPNVFTPNGDSQNDEFKLISVKDVENLEIAIYNRWGNMVFESDKIDFKWNGKLMNSGAECSDGTYFYKVLFKDFFGEEKEEHGFVQLINK